jgi:glycosyltransferase involved in cell wall biosynthesis
MIKLAAFSTHPIQYLVPIYRKLSETTGIDLKVFYASDRSVRGLIDKGFGIPVKWDIPMLQGYDYKFLGGKTLFNRVHGVFNNDRPDVSSVFQGNSFDAVLIPGYAESFYVRAMLAAKKFGIPIMLRSEGSDLPKPGRGIVKQLVRKRFLTSLYRNVGAFLAIGKIATEHFQAHGVPSRKIFLSPYCVDSELLEDQKLKYNLDRNKTRTELGFDDNDFVFLFSGKIIKRKSPLLIVDALSLLPKNRACGLIVMGDGELLQAMTERTKTLQGHRIKFVGFVNQSLIGKYFAASDAFILPSSYETWGLVVNEAQIFGLPVIVSDAVGCHADLVIPHETGLIFKSGDARALSEAMSEFIDKRALATTMGIQGQHLTQHYNVDGAVRGILAALDYLTIAGNVKNC